MTDEIPDFGSLIAEAIKAGQENSPRTQQARGGQLGPSDIGFCRKKACTSKPLRKAPHR